MSNVNHLHDTRLGVKQRSSLQIKEITYPSIAQKKRWRSETIRLAQGDEENGLGVVRTARVSSTISLS